MFLKLEIYILKNESRPWAYTVHKNQLTIIRLNIKNKAIPLLKYNTGWNIGDLVFDYDFLDTTSEAQSMKKKYW